MQTKSKNIEWLDSLRAIATIGVILIHVATPVVKMSYGGNLLNWWVGNFFDSAVRFAVPLFLMLSGATMLGREYNLKDFYKKRFFRVLLPFLFWMVAYWVFRWCVLPDAKQPDSFSSVFSWAIRLLTHEGISKHFWYVYMILFFYLFFPLLGRAMKNLTEKELFWLVLGWALLCFSSRKMDVNFYDWTERYTERLLGYLQYSGYLVLGYTLTRIRIELFIPRYVCAIIFMATVILIAAATYYYSAKSHRLDLDLYSNITFTTMIQAIALFTLLKGTSIRNVRLQKAQRIISNYSYGIYLAHIMVIGIGFQYGVFWTMGHPLWTVPFLVVSTLIISVCIIFVLRKIPYGKYISG